MLGDEGVAIAMQGILQHRPGVTCLDVRDNLIGCKGVESICSALKHAQCNIQALLLGRHS
jgi:hypothetical protein